MRTELSLVWADIRAYRVRMLLTVIGVGASVAAVVWAYGSFSTRQAQAPQLADDLIGRFTGWVTCSDPHRGHRDPVVTPEVMHIPEPLLAQMLKDRRVADLVPVYQTNVDVMSRDSKGRRKRTGPPFRPLTAATPTADPPSGLLKGMWLTPGDAHVREAVILEAVAKTLSIGLGDTLFCAGSAGETRLQVVGILPSPLDRWNMPSAYPAIHVSPGTMRAIQGGADDALPTCNAVYLELAREGDWHGFAADMQASTAARGLWFLSASYLQDQLGGPRLGYGMSNRYIVALAAIGALFVIFTTLNIGFGERVRQLGMLRVLGLHRHGVALMILFESLAAGAGGFCVSLVLGWVVLRTMVFLEPDLFPLGVRLDGQVVGLAAATALAGSLLATILPSVLALRLKPLDVLKQQLQVSSGKARYAMGAIGLLVFLASLLIVPELDLPPDRVVVLTRAMALPGLALGVILMIPVICQAVENLLTPVLARCLGVPRLLAGNELTRHTWRSVGVVLSMTIGLGLYTAFKTWGYTMLKPYQPTDAVPDLTIGFLPEGLSRDQVGAVQAIGGIRADRCLPLTLRQVPLGREAVERKRKIWNEIAPEGNLATGLRDASLNVLLVGLDLEKGLYPPDPVLRLSYKGCSLDTVLARMASGGHCLIPESLANFVGLRVGDTLPVVPRLARRPPGPSAADHHRGRLPDGRQEGASSEILFTVAGIYSDPWHLMSSWTGMRGQHGTSFKSDGLVVVSDHDIARIPGPDRVTFFWAAMTPEFRDSPDEAGVSEIRAALEDLASRQAPYHYTPYGETVPAVMHTPRVRVTSRSFLIRNCLDHASDIISRLSRLPLFALLISALAIANTMMASIRSRRWELGVLRSLGLNRSGLLLLLMMEALLVALAATVSSLLFGVSSGYCVTAAARVAANTRGMPIHLVVPWGHVAAGIGITVLIALAAAIKPASGAALCDPLDLLQEGRAAG